MIVALPSRSTVSLSSAKASPVVRVGHAMKVHRIALALRHGVGDVGKVVVASRKAVPVGSDADNVVGHTLADPTQSCDTMASR